MKRIRPVIPKYYKYENNNKIFQTFKKKKVLKKKKQQLTMDFQDQYFQNEQFENEWMGVL